MTSEMEVIYFPKKAKSKSTNLVPKNLEEQQSSNAKSFISSINNNRYYNSLSSSAAEVEEEEEDIFVQNPFKQLVNPLITSTTQLKAISELLTSILDILNQQKDVTSLIIDQRLQNDIKNYNLIDGINIWKFLIQETIKYFKVSKNQQQQLLSSSSKIPFISSAQSSVRIGIGQKQQQPKDKYYEQAKYELELCKLKFNTFFILMKQIWKNYNETFKVFQPILIRFEKNFKQNLESAKCLRAQQQTSVGTTNPNPTADVKDNHNIEKKQEEEENLEVLYVREFDDAEQQQVSNSDELQIRWGLDGLCLNRFNKWIKFSNCSYNQKFQFFNVFVHQLSTIADELVTQLTTADNLLITSDNKKSRYQATNTRKIFEGSSRNLGEFGLKLPSVNQQLSKVVNQLLKKLHHQKFCPKEQAELLKLIWDMNEIFDGISLKMDLLMKKSHEILNLIQSLGSIQKKNYVPKQDEFGLGKYIAFEITINHKSMNINDILFTRLDAELNNFLADENTSTKSSSMLFSPNYFNSAPISPPSSFIYNESELNSRASTLSRSIASTVKSIQLKHHDIKSEYNEALEQLLKTNIIEIDHLNLCSDNIKEFYIHCQEMIDYIRKTIDHINNLQDQFTMDSSEEHSGLIIRTLFTLKLIMLTCKQLKNDAWFRRTMTVLNDCQELAQEAFNGFDKFSEDFGKEVKRLVNLADTLKQRDTFFEVNLELDEDMINEGICTEQFDLEIGQQINLESVNNSSSDSLNPLYEEDLGIGTFFITTCPNDCSILTVQTRNNWDKPKHFRFTALDNSRKFNLLLIFIDDMMNSLTRLKVAFSNTFSGIQEIQAFMKIKFNKYKKKNSSTKTTTTISELHTLEKTVVLYCIKTLQQDSCKAIGHLNVFQSFITNFRYLIEFSKSWVTLFSTTRKILRNNEEKEEYDENENEVEFDFNEIIEVQRKTSLNTTAEYILTYDLVQYEPSSPTLRKRIAELFDENLEREFVIDKVKTKTSSNIEIVQSVYLDKIWEKINRIRESTYLFGRQLLPSPTSASAIEKEDLTTAINMKLLGKGSSDYSNYLNQFVNKFQIKLNELLLDSLNIALVPKVSEGNNNNNNNNTEVIGYFEGITFLIYSISCKLKEERISVQKLILIQNKFEKLVQNLINLEKMEKEIFNLVNERICEILLQIMTKVKDKLELVYFDNTENLQKNLESCCLPNKQNIFNYIWKENNTNNKYEEQNEEAQLGIYWKTNPGNSIEIQLSQITTSTNDKNGPVNSTPSSTSFSFDLLASISKAQLLLCLLDSGIEKSEAILNSFIPIKSDLKIFKKTLISLYQFLKKLEKRKVNYIKPEETYLIIKVLQNHTNFVLNQWKQMNSSIQHSLFFIHNSFLEICGPGIGKRIITIGQQQQILNPFYYNSNIRLILNTLRYNLNESEYENLLLEIVKPSIFLSDDDDFDEEEEQVKEEFCRENPVPVLPEIQPHFSKVYEHLLKQHKAYYLSQSSSKQPTFSKLVENFQADSQNICQLLESNINQLNNLINFPSASLKPEEEEVIGHFSNSLAIAYLIGHAVIEIPNLSIFIDKVKQDFTFLDCIKNIIQIFNQFNSDYEKNIKPMGSKIDKSLLKLQKKFGKGINNNEIEDHHLNKKTSGSCYSIDSEDQVQNISNKNDNNRPQHCSSNLGYKNILIGWIDLETGLFIQNLSTRKISVFETLNERKQKMILLHLIQFLQNIITSAVKYQNLYLQPNLKKVYDTIKSNKKILIKRILHHHNHHHKNNNNNHEDQQKLIITSTLNNLQAEYQKFQSQVNEVLFGIEEILKCLIRIEKYVHAKIFSEMAVINTKSRRMRIPSVYEKMKAQEIIRKKNMEILELSLRKCIQTNAISVSIEFDSSTAC